VDLESNASITIDSVNGPIVDELLRQATANSAPSSIENASNTIGQLTIGLRQSVPILTSGARLFRVRRLNAKPSLVTDIGPPPPQAARISRLNEAGQSVLYVADSPDTAFAEARAAVETCCLVEWKVRNEKVALANGGIPNAILKADLPGDFRTN
jgi:hypothetical protein